MDTATRIEFGKISITNLNVHFGDQHVIKGVTVSIPDKNVTSIIGPSGCGKSTLLRCMNRMNDRIDKCRISGLVEVGSANIYRAGVDPVLVRQRIGMVFQKANPFPMSIYDNVAYGPRIHGLAKSKAELDHIVETSLKRAALWDEVKEGKTLRKSGLALSGGQQQRLVIARAIAINPEVILMDEPCSSLDPIATAKIEELIDELSENYCIVIVTHNMGQAGRISKRGKIVFLLFGELIEEGPPDVILINPHDVRTQNYVTGRYG